MNIRKKNSRPEFSLQALKATRKSLQSGKVNTAAVAALATSLLIGAPLSADDLEVFTAGIQRSTKPNVLLVLDYSGSMARDINGDAVVADSGLDAKIDILRDAVSAVLVDGANAMNIGVGPLYSRNSGGIQWPIRPITEDAHNTDPAIPAGRFTTADIVNSLLAERRVGNHTATVSAMAEAAQYFRGGAVTSGGANPNQSEQFRPHTWDTLTNSYNNGFFLAPNPSTYTPTTAYQSNVHDSASFSYCSDFSTSGGINECAGLATYDCEFLPPNARDQIRDGQTRDTARNVCKVPHPDRWAGANYNSPIVNECQDNFMILISDGQPTVNGNFAAIRDITGIERDACEDLSRTIFADRDNFAATTGNCGKEIAHELANNDQNPSIPGSVVKTYTVGFSIDGPGRRFLEELALAGQGRFFEANRPEELTDALRSILGEISNNSESFAAVSVDINKATFSSDDRIYFPLFKPDFKPSWQGNIKGYFLDDTGIKDVTGNPATQAGDAGTVFADTTQSFWSDFSDGNMVLEGGLTAKIEPTARNLYTFTGNNIPRAGVALNSVAGSHDLSASNPDIDYRQLQIPNNAANRAELLDWIAAQPMGSPLHSKLQTIDYAGGKRVLYAITNQGFLHAFDVSRPGRNGTNDLAGGDEIFAFMPKELLRNLEPQRTGITTQSHIYGLDGNITRWHDDLNNDGVVNNGEEVLLVFGMRRGGNHYYAMDVTNPEQPVLKWQIDGGTGQFQKLAQTWSRAALLTVNRTRGEERVLVFGGGYDGALDDLNERQQSTGNSVFMVDRDGKLIWSATHPEMNYAIPSDITAIDADNDSIADRMYFGDLGGQVWRVDMDNVDNNADFSIHPIADTSDSGYQPFFYAPSVALQSVSGQSYMTIALGSGNRDNPLNDTSRNAFYVFKDEDFAAGAPPTAPTVIRHNSLYDATDNNVASTDSTIAQTERNLLLTAPGWRIDLEPGEKALSQTVTFAGRLLATTFQPSGDAPADACAAPANTGRFYSLDVVTGEPADHLGDADESLPLNKFNRSTIVSANGIPVSPVIVFPEGALTAQVLVNKELVNEVDHRVRRVYWFAEQ